VAEYGVILVEDDDYTRERLARAIDAHPELRLLGSAATCEAGRALLATTQPDVLITDLGLPDGSGVELIREARQRRAELLALVITVFAHQLLQGQVLTVRQAAWYQKALPTFSDTLAFVRQQLWPVNISWMSPAKDDLVLIPKALFERLTDTLAYAA